MALAEASLLALLVVALVAGTAFAGRGGNKPSAGSSTLSLVLVDDANGNGAPNHRDVVTFSATTTASSPMVGLRCWQGSTWVFDGYVSLYDSWLSKELTLDGAYWSAGVDASCTARLFYYDNRGREQVLTTVQFIVAP